MDSEKDPFRGNTLLVVTGAAGFMGEWALRFAQEHYPVVLAVDIQPIAIPLLETAQCGLHCIRANITKQSDLVKLRKNIEHLLDRQQLTDVVYWHMGAVFNYDEKKAPRKLLDSVNREGALSLLENVVWPLRNRLKSFVFWGGLTVFGNFEQGGIISENSVKVPSNDYGWSKLQAEQELVRFHRMFQLPIVIMELGSVYGPGGPKDKRYGMSLAIKMLAGGLTKPPNLAIGPKPKGAPMIHVEDVIRVADFLAHCPAAQGESYIVIDDGELNSDQIAEILGLLLSNPFKRSPRIPYGIFRKILLPMKRFMHRLSGSKGSFDPGLAEMGGVDLHTTNEKLMALAEKYGRGRDSANPLLKWPRTRDGLEHTVNEYRKEGFIK